MLPANTELDVFAGFAATINGNGNQFAHTVLVKCGKRIAVIDSFCRITSNTGAQSSRDMPQCGLCQIIGAETEEVGRFGNLTRF